MRNFLMGGCLVFVATAVLATGCGGGDDDNDDSDVRSFRGVWQGALTIVENSCNLSPAPTTVNFSHSVGQNEDAIVLTDADGTQFLGNVVGNDGFSVDASGSQNVEIPGGLEGLSTGVTCDFGNQYEYNNVDDSDDTEASVGLRSTGTCTGETTCMISYSGTGLRVSGAQPTAAPTSAGTVAPTITATPRATAAPGAKGSCAEMNPSTYSGDAGCGFGETTFRVNGSSVVLEPLGLNGATSFTILGTNGGAASVRTDLIINADPGYACSLDCTPSSTFTVTCFKEGGVSCAEKF